MMDTNLRRGFLKNLGFLGAFASGAASAKIVIEEKLPEVKPEPKEDISHLAPEFGDQFVLQGNRKYKDYSNLTVDGISTYGIQSWEYANRVQLSVGKDNRLWLQIGDSWHRVALES